jgi:hypothetical protein
MGNLFSRQKDQHEIVNEDDQFFDCLNDDETHEPNVENIPQTISHYYAVWIPPNIGATGKGKNPTIEFLLKISIFRKSIRL